MSGRPGKVLLVDPPWRKPDTANLGLAMLEPLLRGAGFAVDVLYGSHLLPPMSSRPSRPGDPNLFMPYSAMHFLPSLRPATPRHVHVDAIVEAFLHDCAREARIRDTSVTLEDQGLTRATLGTRISRDMDAAEACVARCVEGACAQPYLVVGLSCTFESQIIGALALARRLRAARPDVRIALGGAACFGEPAAELVAGSPWLDAACYGEGEEVAVPLFEALAGVSGSLEHVPGIVWRDPKGAIRRNLPPPRVTDLDRLPVPEYDTFVRSLAAGGFGALSPKLSVETSRGCWWGQKHLCSFCGLNADALTYRRKSPERAFDELVSIWERHPTADRLYATDNVLDRSFLATLMPRLEAWNSGRRRPLRMFWEVRSTLRRDQVRALARSGCDSVQPGIESFSDGVLMSMGKGATALVQVQALKWLAEHDVQVVYAVLLEGPGETAEHCDEMADLVPFLDHLPPPRLGMVELHRFSPYFLHPERFGIRRVRAQPRYRALYPSPELDAERVAYVFDFDHDGRSDDRLRAARRRLGARIDAWGERWTADQYNPALPHGRAYYRDGGDHLLITDRRGATERLTRMRGLPMAVYRWLDSHRALRSVLRRFSQVEPDVLCCMLDTWLRERWICRDARDRLLAVLPESHGSPPRQPSMGAA